MSTSIIDNAVGVQSREVAESQPQSKAVNQNPGRLTYIDIAVSVDIAEAAERKRNNYPQDKSPKGVRYEGDPRFMRQWPNSRLGMKLTRPEPR